MDSKARAERIVQKWNEPGPTRDLVAYIAAQIDEAVNSYGSEVRFNKLGELSQCENCRGFQGVQCSCRCHK